MSSSVLTQQAPQQAQWMASHCFADGLIRRAVLVVAKVAMCETVQKGDGSIKPREFFSTLRFPVSRDPPQERIQEGGRHLRSVESLTGQQMQRAAILENQEKRLFTSHHVLSLTVHKYPQGDLNPCRHRERVASWAGLDDGGVFCSWAELISQSRHPAYFCNRTRLSNHICNDGTASRVVSRSVYYWVSGRTLSSDKGATCRFG